MVQDIEILSAAYNRRMFLLAFHTKLYNPEFWGIKERQQAPPLTAKIGSITCHISETV